MLPDSIFIMYTATVHAAAVTLEWEPDLVALLLKEIKSFMLK